MLELLKLMWDGVVLRDASRKGLLTPSVWLFALAFVGVLYGVGLPLGIYCSNHPANKLALAGLIVFGASMLGSFLFFGFRWYRRKMAALREKSGPSEEGD